jgi:hypothetical protein
VIRFDGMLYGRFILKPVQKKKHHFEVQIGPKVFDQFYIKIKNCKLAGKI